MSSSAPTWSWHTAVSVALQQVRHTPWKSPLLSRGTSECRERCVPAQSHGHGAILVIGPALHSERGVRGWLEGW